MLCCVGAPLSLNAPQRTHTPPQHTTTPKKTKKQVFERVARPVVAGVLAGFNGTVFAYGQTGSGKTFTMTGGAERYADRGLIPRAISAVFDALSGSPSPSQPPPAGDQNGAPAPQQQRHQHHHHNTQVLISYLEIYNEAGYDLLDPRRDATPLADMPQVWLSE